MSVEEHLLVCEEDSDQQGKIGSNSDDAADVKLFFKALVDLFYEANFASLPILAPSATLATKDGREEETCAEGDLISRDSVDLTN